MTYDEISNVLEIDGKESPVFMPNELFSELQNYMVDSSHIAYAYSHMYLTHFLYRNCKYFNVKTLLDNNILKQILGYSKSNSTMNYITQKDKGLLDANGFTNSIKDYPISWTYEAVSGEDLSFTMYSAMGDMKDVLLSIPRMFFLKSPVLALAGKREITRTTYTDGVKKVEEVEVQGTFFDFEQTTQVNFDIFMFCMDKKDLGVIAFYLYSWLKHMNDTHDDGYDVPLTKLSEETGINRRTLNQYMDLLKGYRMITFRHNQEYFSWTIDEKERKANTYFTQSSDSFSKVYKPYAKMKVKTLEEYEEDRIKRETEEEKKKLNIPFSDLPF